MLLVLQYYMLRLHTAVPYDNEVFRESTVYV